MSFLGGLLGGLLSFGGSMANTAMQYAFSREAQQRQFENQKALNVQQTRLQESMNSWNARNIPKLSRSGMEKAGFNPILAINSGSAFSAGGQASAGSAVGASQPSGFDTSSAIDSATNAYRTFQLDRKLNEAQVDLLEAQKKEALSRKLNLDEDTKLKRFDKPLKSIGSLIEDGVLPNVPQLEVNGEIAKTPHNAMQFLKHSLSSAFWKSFDTSRDLHFWLADQLKGNDIPYKYYKGESKRLRIDNNVYHYKNLKRRFPFAYMYR